MINRISTISLFLLYSQYLHTNCGAWEPGEKATVTLPEPTCQLVTAHHLTEKFSSSSSIHRLNSWNPNHGLSSHSCSSCVSPDTLRQSIRLHSNCKIHLSVLSLIRHSSDWKSLLSKIKCLGFLLATLHRKAVLHKDTHHALLYFIWKQPLPCILLLLISVHYLIAPQNSEEIIPQVI